MVLVVRPLLAQPAAWGRAPFEYVTSEAPLPGNEPGASGASPEAAAAAPEWSGSAAGSQAAPATSVVSSGGHAALLSPAPSGGLTGLAPTSYQSPQSGSPSTNRSWFDLPQHPWQNASCTWQILPDGLLYRSYLAGEKEPRFASVWLNDETGLSVWEVALGGRVGIVRYGTWGTVDPQGFQLDIEGGALVRLNPDINTDVEATDFRFGLIGTWRDGPWATKWGYYHISSHLGDEFLLRNPGFPRLNYVRDSAIAGVSYDVTPTVRLYGEAAYAIGNQGGALPLEFQYGVEYSSRQTTWWAPFAGVNGHTREDNDWKTSINIVGGMQFRGAQSQRRLRLGVQYYEGPSLQYSFAGRHERLVGTGLWFDY